MIKVDELTYNIGKFLNKGNFLCLETEGISYFFPKDSVISLKIKGNNFIVTTKADNGSYDVRILDCKDSESSLALDESFNMIYCGK